MRKEILRKEFKEMTRSLNDPEEAERARNKGQIEKRRAEKVADVGL